MTVPYHILDRWNFTVTTKLRFILLISDLSQTYKIHWDRLSSRSWKTTSQINFHGPCSFQLSISRYPQFQTFIWQELSIRDLLWSTWGRVYSIMLSMLTAQFSLMPMSLFLFIFLSVTVCIRAVQTLEWRARILFWLWRKWKELVASHEITWSAFNPCLAPQSL